MGNVNGEETQKCDKGQEVEKRRGEEKHGEETRGEEANGTERNGRGE